MTNFDLQEWQLHVVQLSLCLVVQLSIVCHPHPLPPQLDHKLLGDRSTGRIRCTRLARTQPGAGAWTVSLAVAGPRDLGLHLSLQLDMFLRLWPQLLHAPSLEGATKKASPVGPELPGIMPIGLCGPKMRASAPILSEH